jgi:hypothetical protein
MIDLKTLVTYAGQGKVVGSIYIALGARLALEER